MEDQVEQEYLHHRRQNIQMIAAPPWDMLQERQLPQKTGLYDLEVISLWECYFRTGGLAYDKLQVSTLLYVIVVLEAVESASLSILISQDNDVPDISPIPELELSTIPYQEN